MNNGLGFTIRLLILCISARDTLTTNQFKLLVPAGGKECVYFHSDASATFSMETKVYGKSPNIPGPIEIAMSMKNGSEDAPFSHYAVLTETSFLLTVGPESHRYEVCYDNQMATLISKKVYLGLFPPAIEWNDSKTVGSHKTEESSLLADSLASIKEYLERVERLQSLVKMSHASDFQRALDRNFWVDAWSLLHLVFMCTVSFVQVIFVKKLFSTY